jgi:hypothetical protein
MSVVYCKKQVKISGGFKNNRLWSSDKRDRKEKVFLFLRKRFLWIWDLCNTLRLVVKKKDPKHDRQRSSWFAVMSSSIRNVFERGGGC